MPPINVICTTEILFKTMLIQRKETNSKISNDEKLTFFYYYDK